MDISAQASSLAERPQRAIWVTSVRMRREDRTSIHMERVFTDINADHGNRSVEVLGHGVLLCLWSPLPDSSLAGQGHGRTIPLADVAFGQFMPAIYILHSEVGHEK